MAKNKKSRTAGTEGSGSSTGKMQDIAGAKGPDTDDTAAESPSAAVAVTKPGIGDRIEWLRVKFEPGPAAETDLVVFGQFGRVIDGTMEIILYGVDDSTALTEVGTLYIQKSRIAVMGYESSFVTMQEQADLQMASTQAAEDAERVATAKSVATAAAGSRRKPRTAASPAAGTDA